MRRRRAVGLTHVVVALSAVVASACAGQAADSPAPQTVAESQAIATPTATPLPTPPPASIDLEAPLTQSVNAAFDPPFTLRVPADWTAVLRDASAFQAYAGSEDYEITFDHTYRSAESVNQAIARLSATAGLESEPAKDVVVGGRKGQGFVAESSNGVQFVDSGFHTNRGYRFQVVALPAGDGTTITIFLTSEGNTLNGLDMLGPLARRIFRTVVWK